MNAKDHEDISELVRVTIRELFQPMDMLDKEAESDDKIYQNLQEVSQACAPAMRVQQVRRLCEAVEARLTGKVTGWLARECSGEAQGLRSAFEKIQQACNAYMDFVRPYNGVGGYVKTAQDFVAAPWNVVTMWFGATDYQRQRDKLLAGTVEGWNVFGEAIQALILALESAISRHTGQHFSFATPV